MDPLRSIHCSGGGGANLRARALLKTFEARSRPCRMKNARLEKLLSGVVSLRRSESHTPNRPNLDTWVPKGSHFISHVVMFDIGNPKYRG